MCYQNLKKLSFRVKIVFSDKPPSLCKGVFTNIKSKLGEIYNEIYIEKYNEIYNEIGQHFVCLQGRVY